MIAYTIDNTYLIKLREYVLSTSSNQSELQAIIDILETDAPSEQDLNIILFFLQYRPWIEVNDLITTFTSSIFQIEK